MAETSSPSAAPVLKVKEIAIPPHIATYFIAGGVAGAASRTVVSPLERLKIIQQVQPQGQGKGAYSGVWRSLVRMWKEEGFKGFMRGNGANCIRIVPYSAVQFTTYEQLKKFFSHNGDKPLDTVTRLTAGALAGITSVCSTYPLDLVRARLSIVSASLQFAPTVPQAALAILPSSPKTSAHAVPSTSLAASLSTSASVRSSAGAIASKQKMPGMWSMVLLVYREEGGIRGLYRGMVPTAVGVAPYVGINFTAYETLRIYITPPEYKDSIPRKLLCGALAGSISQSLTYPFDVLRRKMQVVGMKSTSGAGSLGYQYTGAWDALRTTVRVEGFKGLYRGLWPNLLKVAPSIATSFFTYELVKEFLITH